MKLTRADFVVFGGGPSGASAAIALARQSARVILFERGPSSHPKPGEIVESSVQRPLRELGIWDGFLKLQALRSAGTLSAWDSDRPFETSSIRNPWGGGFLIDRTAFEAFLLNEARALGVQVILSPEALDLAPPANNRRSVLWRAAGKSFEAQPAMYIEATGRAGGVTGQNHRQKHDDLIALLRYTQSEPTDDRDLRLHIEAAAEGWWYAAALPHGVSVTAFMTDAQHVPRGLSARQQFFSDQLKSTKLICEGFGSEVTDHIRVAPANSSIRLQLNGDDWVAIGDAAAAYDPLAGLGVVAALSKGVAIARLLTCEPSATSAAGRYAALERQGFQNYLAGRRSIYRRLDHWKDQPFWKHRTQLQSELDGR